MTAAQAIALGRRPAALRTGALAFAWSRALIVVVAAVAVLVWGVDSGNEGNFDQASLTHPLGGSLAPLARWDSVWYLDIAHSGYDGGQSTAFFPLYPLLVRVVAAVSAPGALLVAAYAVSLACLFGALYLMHRLVSLELGPSVARVSVLMLAAFPGSLWLGAPYSESLFLLLSLAAFWFARTDRWALAGIAAALASATRSAGLVLVVPLAILWWQGRRRTGDLGWIALAPLGLVAFSVYLAASIGDGFAYLHLQETWFRHFAGPFGAVPDGAVAAWDGLRQIVSGSRTHVYFTAAGGDPIAVGWHNVELFAFLVFAAIATVGAWRRLPRAYGAYLVAALALPLSFPVTPQPLMSLPRFLAVLFPIFMWLGLVCRTPRRQAVALAALGLMLGLFTARYATWHWVA